MGGSGCVLQRSGSRTGSASSRALDSGPPALLDASVCGSGWWLWKTREAFRCFVRCWLLKQKRAPAWPNMDSRSRIYDFERKLARAGFPIQDLRFASPPSRSNEPPTYPD
eukprot:scaffold77612_cov66-Phaeocystis_antarctica.AAC.4